MDSEKYPDFLQSAAEFAHEHQLVFPSVPKAYKLLLTVPVSVAKEERTFRKTEDFKELPSFNNEERAFKGPHSPCMRKKLNEHN